MKCFFCDGELVNHLNTKNYVIEKCRKCEIAITTPKPLLPEYELLDFHNDALSPTNRSKQLSDLPPSWKQLIKSQVELVCKNVVNGSRVLEIGCGEGLLLGEIFKKGYIVKGIEPSEKGAKRALLSGIDVYQGYFKAEVLDVKYDIVIMSHVLEHIEFPNEIIDDILKILNPGGLLMLTQTNYKGLIPSILKERWYAWVPDQHFWHFTIKGLTLWLLQFGFRFLDKNYVSLVHPNTFKYKPLNFFNSIFKSYSDQYIVIFQKPIK